MDDILDRGIIGEGDHHGLVKPKQRTTDHGLLRLFLDLLDEQRSLRIRPAPGDRLVRKASRLDAVGDEKIVTIVNDRLTLIEKHQFLQAFLGSGDKILLMGLADVGNHTDRRSDNRLQTLHLIRLRDTCLEDA